ncbi:MAG: SDR family oxidoreductase [Armatimonadetes bacterium]|nr:SDR family oxidoreductase [Armatimonadota bacterium]
MRVFVTGATGFVGSAVVDELIGAGHQVLGLARSEEGAAALAAAGADVLRGTLEDADILRRGAASCDGVAHLGFIHDFSRFAEVCAVDQAAINVMGEALVGSERPLLTTSGLAMLAPGRVVTENTPAPDTFPRKSEAAANALAARGVRAASVRLAPSVHGPGDHGFVPMLIGIARKAGVSAYIGDGANRWPGVHRLDAARVYRLALEKSVEAGAWSPNVFHATAEEGVPTREIAEVIGHRLGVPVRSISPEEAGAHFDFLATFFALDCAASSALTQERLGWTPTGPGLLADVDSASYFGG